jgi:putative hemolysin
MATVSSGTVTISFFPGGKTAANVTCRFEESQGEKALPAPGRPPGNTFFLDNRPDIWLFSEASSFFLTPSGGPGVNLTTILSVIGLVVLLSLSAFFSGSETALFSLGKLRIRRMKGAGNTRAGLIEKMLGRPSKLLISILVGNMFVNIMASSLATVLFVSLFAHRGEIIAFAAMSVAILIFGEITPKFLAVNNPDRFSTAIAGPLWTFSRIIASLVGALERITESLVHLLEGGRRAKATAPTEEELMTVVELSHKEGIVDPVELRMILRAFEFGHLPVSDVMTPRTEIFSLAVDTPAARARSQLQERGFSRVPVYRQDPEEIIGIVHAIDLVADMFSSPRGNLEKYIRSAPFVPEVKKVGLLLREFQKTGTHMAIVIDEHGGLSGLVTLEDLLEEIVGEIVDRKERLPAAYHRLDRKTAVVAGTMELNQFNEVFRTGLEHPEYKTIAGFIIGHLGRIPEEGESVEWNGLSFKVLKAVPNRIIALRVRTSRKTLSRRRPSKGHR